MMTYREIIRTGQDSNSQQQHTLRNVRSSLRTARSISTDTRICARSVSPAKEERSQLLARIFLSGAKRRARDSKTEVRRRRTGRNDVIA
jgi:hypothetical protein